MTLASIDSLSVIVRADIRPSVGFLEKNVVHPSFCFFFFFTLNHAIPMAYKMVAKQKEANLVAQYWYLVQICKYY